MAASNKSGVASSTTDFSSDSTLSDDWQELTKSDYAKVIFSDLLCNAAAGTVECKFQITDNVHEDPNDYVGLFRIGYDDLSQCLVSKMLSQTKCEDDGKLQRCVFTSNELPCLDDSFYQFLYVTRDQEVCGASMPFQIKMTTLPPKGNSGGSSSSSENMDGGFLLVKKETEKKAEDSKVQSKFSPQRNALSEQKQEEIAAWVSQNPDYYSLTEQVREQTFTIDALQQSKDLAMKELAQLYDILQTQNSELVQLRTMVSAYEEKIKMNQRLQEEKTKEFTEMRTMLATYEEGFAKDQVLQRQNNLLMTEMKQSLTTYEEKAKSNELLLKEKQEELNEMKKQFHQQDQELKSSLDYQDKQEDMIDALKKELEEMKEKQKENEYHQVAAKAEGTIDMAVQKAQDFISTINDTIKNLDYTDENEVDKFLKLKCQLLVILRKVKVALDQANICNQDELHKASSSIKKDETKNSSVEPIPDPFEIVAAVVNTPPKENPGERRPFFNACLAAFANDPQAQERLHMEKQRAAKEAAIKKDNDSQSVFDFLDRETNELPRLDVINEDTAKTLLTDHFLDAEDIAVINNVSEKITNSFIKVSDLLEIEDSVSDSGSDESGFSECASSLKRDLISMTKVMQVLSSGAPQKTNLENLLVVESEEDKNLLHKNNYKELLQKCFLRYRIELLHDYIEKQKEATKKLTDKICDLMSKYMVMKDDAVESKVNSKKLESAVIKRDRYITQLEAELEFKTSLICQYFTEKEKAEEELKVAENTVKDYHARIMEAAKLYKNQYTEIERLTKLVKKSKPVQEKTKPYEEKFPQSSSKSPSYLSSFEVVVKETKQNVNDSDTGERVFAFATMQDVVDAKRREHAAKQYIKRLTEPAKTCLDTKEGEIKEDPEIRRRKDEANAKIRQVVFRRFLDNSFKDQYSEETVYEYDSDTSEDEASKDWDDRQIFVAPSADSFIGVVNITRSSEKPATVDELLCRDSIGNASANPPNIAAPECESNEKPLVITEFASYQHFQDVIKENFAKIKQQPPVDMEECLIACYGCHTMIALGRTNYSDLMNHLEHEHSMKVCPVCGQLFENAVPSKYYQIHINQHFEKQ